MHFHFFLRGVTPRMWHYDFLMTAGNDFEIEDVDLSKLSPMLQDPY
jgi:hypothetical protein